MSGSSILDTQHVCSEFCQIWLKERGKLFIIFLFLLTLNKSANSCRWTLRKYCSWIKFEFSFQPIWLTTSHGESLHFQLAYRYANKITGGFIDEAIDFSSEKPLILGKSRTLQKTNRAITVKMPESLQMLTVSKKRKPFYAILGTIYVSYNTSISICFAYSIFLQ